MLLRKITVILIFAALLLGFAVFYMGYRFLPPPEGKGYAVLSLDVSYEDRYIGELLDQGNGGPYISESTQWVFWDDFGELIRLPLESYGDRVESFDPRNDGYARRLESFFVHEGKRFFFIPLSPDVFGTSREKFEETLARCLEGIPFQVEFPGGSRPWGIYALLFAGAAAGMLLLSGAPRIGISLIPLLGALSYWGPAGFALAASLTALFGLLLQPGREFFISRRYRSRYTRMGKKTGRRGFRWGVSPLFAAVYGVICFLGRFPLSLGVAGIFSFFIILGLSLWAEAARGTGMGHVRFVPVSISVHSMRIKEFSRIMVPFALGSLGALVLPSLIIGSHNAAGDNLLVPAEWRGYMINSGEYEAHAAFQASFSLRPFRTGGDNQDSGEYLRYHRGGDGLIGDYSAVEGGHTPEVPPFPLEDLMNFLSRREYIRSPAYTSGDLFSVLAVLFFCIPFFLPIQQGHSKKKRLLVYNDKRIAA
jgi:hypothetical protein